MSFFMSRGILRVALAIAIGMGTSPSIADSIPKPPRLSDGSSGSFDGQFRDGDCLQWINVDTGQVWCSDSGGFVFFTVPFKAITYNGQSVHAFNFTDFNMESTVHLIVYGNTPAIFLAQQDINIAGTFRFQTVAGSAGVPSNGNPNSNGGAGGGLGGGQGGSGRGGETEACNSFPVGFTGGGGGGGGNYSAGLDGLHGYWPSDVPHHVHLPPGPGGLAQNDATLQGGGGGAAGGGGDFEGNFFGGPFGGVGGGSVVFSTPGMISVASTGVLDASGANGGVQQTTSGGSGGGAGGDTWFFARGGFINAGQVLANGGQGGASNVNKAACSDEGTVPGPNGGDGSGGVIIIKSKSISNTGTIDYAGGDGRKNPNGGKFIHSSKVKNRGKLVGEP
jgi:hypothetical protein